mmetsp:Transcript_13939/g.27097  ORF Transcript_13939/g.27097 Transcript_13939/m.27097 type:complete len:288 (+) Transcript_13939:188-1051(+)
MGQTREWDWDLFVGNVKMAATGVSLMFVLALVAAVLLSIVFAVALLQVRKIRSVRREEHLVLVTAHPDDESMFFVPTIRAFRPDRVTILCLSTGNFDGIGLRRKHELLYCCTKFFGLKEESVRIEDHPEMQDDPRRVWAPSVVADFIEEKLKELAILPAKTDTMVVSFDEEGVSGHLNHVAVSLGIAKLAARRQADPHLSFYSLESLQLPAKYLGPATAWEWYSKNPQAALQFYNGDMNLSYAAMSAHASQFVWYRRLFVIFSCYTFCNRLRPLFPNRCLVGAKKVD